MSCHDSDSFRRPTRAVVRWMLLGAWFVLRTDGRASGPGCLRCVVLLCCVASLLLSQVRYYLVPTHHVCDRSKSYDSMSVWFCRQVVFHLFHCRSSTLLYSCHGSRATATHHRSLESWWISTEPFLFLSVQSPFILERIQTHRHHSSKHFSISLALDPLDDLVQDPSPRQELLRQYSFR